LGGTAIALSRFKMSNEDIKQAILRLDESKLSAESVEVRPSLLHLHRYAHAQTHIFCPRALLNSSFCLQTLLNYIPTPEEIEQLTAYTDDRSKLGKAEQYFLTVKVRHLTACRPSSLV
jgi:hypothetical protein